MARTITPAQVFKSAELRMGRPFAWGVCDCCISACDVFRDLHGIDPMADLRSRYRSKAEAVQLIREFGSLTALAASIAMRIGAIEGHKSGGISLSQQGDSVMVCIDDGIWAAKGKSGLSIIKTAGMGWHV